MTHALAHAAAIAQRIAREPTGRKRAMRLAVPALGLLLALAPAAEAKSFRGETSQKRFASVIVGAGGQVSRIRISYSAPCTDPRYRFPNVLRIEPPFDEASAEAVTEKLTLRDRPRDGGTSRQTVTVTARRTISASGAESWRGTFKTRVVLMRGDKRLDTCELKRVTWSARPVR